MSARGAPSCSSTQLPRTPSSGAGSSIGRWVWVPLVAMMVRYMPGVEPEPGDHPADQGEAVAREHAEVVTRPVVHVVGQRDLDVPGRPIGVPRAVRRQLDVGGYQGGPRPVGQDDRVGQLPVDHRDGQPRTGRCRPAVARSAAQCGGDVRPQVRVPRAVLAVEVAVRVALAARVDPRGRRAAPAARPAASAPPDTLRPSRCRRSRTPCRRRRRGRRRPSAVAIQPAERRGVLRRLPVVGGADDQHGALARAGRCHGRRARRR